MTETAGIYARNVPALDRWVQLGVAGGKLISLSVPQAAPSEAASDHPLLDRIDRYLDGEHDDFSDVDVGLTVPTSQRQVLESLRAVPYGETVGIERLVRMSGLDAEDDDDRGLVRDALAANPIPVVLPDHRVRDGPSALPAEVVERLRRLEGQ